MVTIAIRDVWRNKHDFGQHELSLLRRARVSHKELLGHFKLQLTHMSVDAKPETNLMDCSVPVVPGRDRSPEISR
jgi:hypothetical protein